MPCCSSLVRRENALHLTPEAVAEGAIGAIAPFVRVLDRLDRCQRGVAPLQAYDKEPASGCSPQAQPFARALATTAAKLSASAAEGGSPDAAEPPAPERNEVRPLNSPASP
jgi:hypothetical protein